MFGFLSPGCRIPRWRQNYAHVCQYQRRLFGLTSLPFLSYEATFLYQLAVDYQFVPRLSDDAPECCRLKRLKLSDDEREDVAASFAAAFGMMLAGVKLQDDVEDSGRWYNRLLRWKYVRPVKRAHKLIASVAADVPARVRAAIQQHAVLEAMQSAAPLEEYSAPTGDGFAAVFEGFLNCFVPDVADEFGATFHQLGDLVGRAIIAWDCAVDFERDRIRGEFNPLQTEDEVLRAFDECLLCLARIGWLLPSESVSRDVVAGVAARVRVRRSRRHCTPSVRRLERWGLVRQKGFAYARCDGCDALCAVGECCECVGGAGEAASGCGECATCCNAPNMCALPCPLECCDCCLVCGEEGPCGNGKKKSKQSGVGQSTTEPVGPYAEFVGRNGTADTNLNPSGYITIDGKRIPAKTASSDFLTPGTPVHVIRADPFGVTVVDAP